jgi:hypothetical protein
MEEQILKIILNGESAKYPTFNIAKEVTSHVMQFIEWLGSDVETIVRYDSIEIAYKHWFNNVYSK